MALQAGHRLLFLTLVVLGLWIAAWGTGVTGRFTSESIRSFIGDRGIWGIVAFIGVFSGGQLLRVSSTAFVACGPCFKTPEHLQKEAREHPLPLKAVAATRGRDQRRASGDAPRPRVDLSAALVTTALAVSGFWPTYFGLLVAGSVAAPAVVQVHAAVFITWLLLFVVQVVFSATGRIRLHIRLGRWMMAYGLVVIGAGLMAASEGFTARLGPWPRHRRDSARRPFHCVVLRNNSETFVADTFVSGWFRHHGEPMESLARSIGPLGAHGQRHRMLFHHIPLAIASVGLIVLFTTLPRFDVNAYDHVDLMTGAFPQARASAAETKPDAQAHAHGQGMARGTNHGSERATAMEHGHDARSAESRPVAHGEARRGTSEHGRDLTQTHGQQSVSLSRIVQQLTVATGYVGVGLLAVTLLLGPANLVLGRRNPVSTYLRRDVGIWTAIFSVVHVMLAVAIHVSHGSGVVTAVLHFFVAEDGRPLTNSFGSGNWTGLAALVIVLGLLATSSDAALRMLRARPWKWLQRLTYALFVLVVLHAVFYGALLRMASPFTRLLLLSVAMVLVGQLVGVWLWRRRHVSSASLALEVRHKEQCA